MKTLWAILKAMLGHHRHEWGTPFIRDGKTYLPCFACGHERVCKVDMRPGA